MIIDPKPYQSTQFFYIYFFDNLERMRNIEVRKRDPDTSDPAGPAICLFFYRLKSHDKTSSPNNETYDTGMEFRQNY